ncbi:MAG: hypothetical protein IJF88_07585 [Oscillospiraceae bacterium]|nr:hypothetical protein [Oscillospiraceae bacterium]
MGLFDSLLKKPARESKTVDPDIFVRTIGDINSYNSIDAFNRDYLAMRDEQELWLEHKYDFTTEKGIEEIPLNAVNAPNCSDSSSTGSTDMYLRRRGFQYEQDGEEKLALACLKRSNEIRFYKKLGYRKDDYYSYVRMLVHFGYVTEAYKEKKRIDSFFGDYVDDSHSVKWTYSLRFLHGEKRRKRKEEIEKIYLSWDNIIPFEIERTNKRREYQFVLENLPDLCPKSQAAYTRAKNGCTKKYLEITTELEKRGLQLPKGIENM